MGITVKKTINMEPSVQKVRQAVIQFVSDYYRRSVNTRVPSLREICRDEKVVQACGGACYSKKLEPVFPPELDGSGPLMKRVCEASRVPAPTARIRKARKATEAKVKKAKKVGRKKPAKRDVEPAVAEAQETTRQSGSLEDLQRSIEIQMEQRRYRKEIAEEKAKEIKLLALDPNEEISGPVLDALDKVVPKILERRYGVSHDLATIHKRWPELLKFFDDWGQNVTAKVLCEWSYLTPEEKETFKELCMIREKAGTPDDTISQLLDVSYEWAKLPEDMKRLVEFLCERYVRSGIYPTLKDAIILLEVRKMLNNHIDMLNPPRTQT